jgi:hypothetical protein
LRVTADNLNRLLGLAGESLVESRWLKPFAESLLRLKRLHYDTGKTLSGLREALSGQALNEQAQTALADVQRRVIECRQFLSERLAALEAFDSRSHQSGAAALRRGADLPHAAVHRRGSELPPHRAGPVEWLMARALVRGRVSVRLGLTISRVGKRLPIWSIRISTS